MLSSCMSLFSMNEESLLKSDFMAVNFNVFENQFDGAVIVLHLFVRLIVCDVN